MNKLSQFWQELKRRKVVRVITVYAAAAFVILELVDIIAEPLKLPEWFLPMVIVLLCIGFIIAIILSWIYDKHPEGGIVKTEPAIKVSEESVKPSSRGWEIASYISFVVIVGLIVLNVIPRSNNKEILEKSIAVLPFRNDSPEQTEMYFIDGTMESILDNLCKIKDLRVVSRTSVEQYRDNPKPMPTVGEEMNVSYVIEGSGLKHGDNIRLTIQLIDAKHDQHIWSNTYNRKTKEIFELQSEIAQLVAAEIEAVITPEEKQRIENIPTANIEAYNLYLQGRYFWNQGRRVDLDKSIEYYKRALEIDPNYALAYSGMAATYTSYTWGGYLPRRDVMPQAKTAAMKALEIDNTLGEAHAELAWARVVHDWDWTGGEKGFKRALELNSNNARAHNGYAWLLTFVGRHDEAIEESKRAHELDPLSNLNWSLGYQYYYARDYDKAIEEYRKVLEIFPRNLVVHSHLALALSAKGLHNEAIEECLKIDFKDWNIGYIYGAAGKMDEAQEILNYYLELSKKQFVRPVIFAFIYIGLGEKDKAFEWLEKTYEQREAFLDLIKVEPMYDSLRSDPRFQDLVERMNFPE